jgi:membrane associated rhomboid family serine protease
MLLTRWVTRLLIANVVIYFLQLANPLVERALMFVPALVLERPWTIVTYMFLHGSMTHILFNMLGLFFFGPRLELELGSRQFLLLYFIAGISGAILSLFLAPMAAIIGASGGVYGVFLGFAYLWPRAQIYIWGMIPVEARWLVVGMTALSLFGGAGGSSDGTAHFAHLGGFLGGYIYLRWFVKTGVREAPASAPVVAMPSNAELKRWEAIPTEGMHPVNREELERIREKLRTSGPANLTLNERAFLDRFSGNA